MEKTCPNCGKTYYYDVKKCADCGHVFTENPESEVGEGTPINEDEGNNYLWFNKNNGTTQEDSHTMVVDKLETADKKLLAQNLEEHHNLTIMKKQKRKKWILIGSIITILIIAAIISSMLYSSYKEKQQEEARKAALIALEQQLCDSYIKYMNNGTALMYTDAADAEEICNLISEVWYNSIYHESDKKTNKYTAGTNDFNDAISNVYADKDILDKIQDMFETEKK